LYMFEDWALRMMFPPKREAAEQNELCSWELYDLLGNCLPPRTKIPLEMRVVSHPAMEFLAFYGTARVFRAL
jgi:hypothetical protein